MTPPVAPADITDRRDRHESSESTLAADPIEAIDANEPIDPTDRKEPTEPIDSIEPFDPIDRNESSDHRDSDERRAGAIATGCHRYVPAMPTIEIVFETHSTSEDNERGVATGWLPGRLSAAGREQAREMGERRRDDGFDAVLTSDLARAVETTTIAFAGAATPILHDWRLRECDYGRKNGMPVAELHGGRRRHVDEPYPGGESWRQAVDRVGRLLPDLPVRWDGCRVLLVGHTATRWALDHFLAGAALEDLLDAPFEWQPGWEYRYDA
jgi:broad specificity phosphatase PhoE